MTVRRIDLRTRRAMTLTTVPLDHEQGPGGLAVGGGRVLWIIRGHPSTAVILDMKSSRRTVVQSAAEGCFSYPIATNRYMAWAEGNCGATASVGGYLFRLTDQSLWSLGNTSGLYDIEGKGSVVAWQESSAKAAKRTDTGYVIARMR
jgi:hypothetical protein